MNANPFWENNLRYKMEDNGFNQAPMISQRYLCGYRLLQIIKKVELTNTVAPTKKGSTTGTRPIVNLNFSGNVNEFESVNGMNNPKTPPCATRATKSFSRNEYGIISKYKYQSCRTLDATNVMHNNIPIDTNGNLSFCIHLGKCFAASAAIPLPISA